MPYNSDNLTIAAALPPTYVQTIAVDAAGFVRIGGVCVGRLIREGEAVYFEVKDRNAARSVSRGAQMIRVPVADVVRTLAE